MKMKQMEIGSWISKQIENIIPSFQNDFERSLREYGFTSLQLVNLVVSIEDHFDIQFTPEEITGEDFLSVASICGLVDRKLASANS